MQEGKIYSLKLNIKSVLSKNLRKNTQYAVKITKCKKYPIVEPVVNILGPFKISQGGEIFVNEKIEFKIPSGELKRDSKVDRF